MAAQVFPTKGNLIATQKTLQLSVMGFDLMDRKRNILIREMMALMEESRSFRSRIDDIYERAYKELAKANIALGIIDNIVEAVPIDDGLTIQYRSVMGVDIPIITHEQTPSMPTYGLISTNAQLDYACMCFREVREITVQLAEVENSAYRLANAIVKTQRRANALKNVVIPNLRSTVKYISDSLEEKEREEFSRLKVIKNSKEKAAV